MNLNEAIDLIFQAETVLIPAVVPIKDTRITFRGQNVGVSKHLVPDYRSSDAAAVGVVVLYKRDCTLWINAYKPGVVERSHVEVVRVVTHIFQGKMKRKVKRG